MPTYPSNALWMAVFCWLPLASSFLIGGGDMRDGRLLLVLAEQATVFKTTIQHRGDKAQYCAAAACGRDDRTTRNSLSLNAPSIM